MLSGVITENTPDMLRTEFLVPDNYDEEIDTYIYTDMDRIILESPGGSLPAALEVGRILRKTGLKVQVGGFSLRETDYTEACLSACAYAFLGGTKRVIEVDGQIGFHKFFVNAEKDNLVRTNAILDQVQKFSSDVIAYIVEMGIDARVFVEASETASDDLLVFDEATLQDYHIVTNDFTHFILEPFQDGIAATSDRLTPIEYMDELVRLTAYCQNETPYLLFTDDYAVDEPRSLSIFYDLDEDAEIWKPSDSVSSEDVILVDTPGLKPSHRVTLTNDLSNGIVSAENLVIQLTYLQAVGPPSTFRLVLNAKDRKFLKTAFKVCA